MKNIAVGEGGGSAEGEGSAGAASGASFFISFEFPYLRRPSLLLLMLNFKLLNVLFCRHYSVDITY